MPNAGIVRGQRVSRSKVARAKELRAEMTPQEQSVWERLRNNRLRGLHFRRQQIIDGFLADFYCHRAAVVIELDGLVHLRQTDYDRERDKAISLHQLQVIRISNDQIDMTLEQTLEAIAAACLARLPRPDPKPLLKAPPSLKGRGPGG
jgi:very-short-patch-repair endonuclease